MDNLQYEGPIGAETQKVLEIKKEGRFLGKKIVIFMNTKTGIMKIFFM